MSASTTWALVDVSYDLDTVPTLPGTPIDAYTYQTQYLLGALTINAAWTFHSRWTAEVGLPIRFLQATSGWVNGQGDPAGTGDLNDAQRIGLGEASLAVRTRLLSSKSFLIDARLGAWLPTTRSFESPFAQSVEKAERHQIFGNGTIDPMGSLAMYYLAAPWRATASGWARVPLVANDHGQVGSTLLGLNVSVDRQLHSPTLRAMVGLGSQLAFPAAWPGPRAPTDARTTLVGRIAIYWLPSDTWQWNFGVDLPWIIQSVEGTFSMPVMLRIGVSHQLLLP